MTRSRDILSAALARTVRELKVVDQRRVVLGKGWFLLLSHVKVVEKSLGYVLMDQAASISNIAIKVDGGSCSNAEKSKINQ